MPFAIGFFILKCIMVRKLNLGEAGRVVIPKCLRDRLQPAPGDTLEVEGDDDRITLRPVRSKAKLIKESGIWVYQGEAADDSIPDLIERERENRRREVRE
jgi:AbrB family looped-hinge helix DNA binding protein